MIHLYAVAEGLTDLPQVGGLADAPLERLSVDGLDLVVSEAPAGMWEASEEDVLRHAQVVEALMRRSASVLPGRLGPAFSDEPALRRAVESDAGRLKRALARARGCVELGLRVVEQGRDPVADALGGAEYMEKRLEEKQKRDRLADRVHEPLVALARASRRGAAEAPGVLLDATYLVPAEDVERFRDHVARLESDRDGLSFVLTGPWPPYSFGGDE
jgi:Gas vesicle synthesis protein GvpL/GvpF